MWLLGTKRLFLVLMLLAALGFIGSDGKSWSYDVDSNVVRRSRDTEGAVVSSEENPSKEENSIIATLPEGVVSSEEKDSREEDTPNTAAGDGSNADGVDKTQFKGKGRGLFSNIIGAVSNVAGGVIHAAKGIVGAVACLFGCADADTGEVDPDSDTDPFESLVAGGGEEHEGGETTEAPAEEVTEAPPEEVTEAPAEEVTEAPAEEVTEPPAEEVTEAPAEEATEAPAE